MYRREGEGFQRLGELSSEGGDGPGAPLLPELAISLATLFSR